MLMCGLCVFLRVHQQVAYAAKAWCGSWHTEHTSLSHILTHSQQDEVGVILSSCQRLGLAPSQEWLSPLAESFLANIDSKDKVSIMRTDNFVRPLVGLAGMGWKPSAEQWQTLLDAAAQLMPLGYYRGRQLLETAWAFAQFGNPVPNSWSQVRRAVCAQWICTKGGLCTRRVCDERDIMCSVCILLLMRLPAS